MAITVPNRGQPELGSGVFVAPDLVITCAHVVADQAGAPKAEFVRGVRPDRELDLRVVPEWVRPWADGKGPDLALLRVLGDREPQAPWVELRDVVDIGDELWAYGYPQGPYRAGDSAVFRYEGPSRSAGSVLLHKLARGQAQPGLSGAPVLNRRTGGVVGLVRASRDRYTDLGARLVTATLIAAEYGVILAAELDGLVDRPWLDALSDAQLRAGRWARPSQALFDYLKAAQQQALDFPYAVPVHIAPPLIELYVEQKVTPKAAERRGPEQHDKQRDHERKIDTVLATKLLSQHRNALLTGGPGAGKSSLFNFLVADAARKWLRPAPGEASPDFVPARLSATRLAETPGPLASAVASILSQDLVDHLRESLPADFLHRPPAPGVDWLVLVDGVDEVLDQESRRKLLERLSQAIGEDEHLRIAIATRPLTEQQLGVGYAEYELQPFDPDELATFARKLFDKHGSTDPSAETRRFTEQLVGSSLYELCRTAPLLATMTWAMYVDYPDRPLPSGRAELYRWFVDKLLHEQDRKLKVTDQLREMLRECPGAEGVVASLIGDRMQLIADIAAARHQGSEHSLLELALGYLAGRKPAGGITDGRWRELVRDLLIRTGLVGAKGRELVFTHHTFQEYFTAARMATTHTPTDEQGRLLLERGIRSNQQTVTLFLAGHWAMQGADLSEAILWLLRRGDMQANLAAAVVIDGVPVSDECAENLVVSLGIMSHFQATEVLQTFKRVAPHLDNSLLRRIAEAEHVDPLIRITALLTTRRRTGGVVPPPELWPIARHIASGKLFSAVDLLDEFGFRAAALKLLGDAPATALSNDLQHARCLYRLGETAAATELLLGILSADKRDIGRMTEAAHVLADHDSALAVEHVLRLAASPTLSAYDKYRCAEVLREAGAVDDARLLYEQVFRDPTADDLDFTWAAESLSELGFRRMAIDTLTEATRDSRRTMEFRLRVIEQLNELNALNVDLAPTLVSIRDNPTAGTHHRIDIVTLLSSVDDSIDEIDELLRLNRLPGNSIDSTAVAKRLVELKALDAARELLLEALDDVSVRRVVSAAMELVELGFWDEAAAPLRAVVHDRHRSMHDRSFALSSLRQFRAAAADTEVIAATAHSPAFPVTTRIAALQGLVVLPDNQWSVDHIRHWTYSRDATAQQRLDAMVVLLQAEHGSWAAHLEQLTHPDVPLAHAIAVLQASPHEKWDERILQVLRGLMDRSAISAHDRESVRFLLSNTLSSSAQQEAQLAVALDAARPSDARVEACRWLHSWSGRVEVDDVLLDLVERPNVPPVDVVEAAVLLVERGVQERGAQVLRRVAQDGSASASARCRAAEHLAALLDLDTALNCWRDVLASREWGLGEYGEAAWHLATVDLLDEAVAALRAFIGQVEEKPSNERAAAAVHLSSLGHHEEAVQALDGMAAEKTADIFKIADAFESIQKPRRASELCARLVRAEDADEEDHLNATRLMCRHDAFGAVEANRSAVEAGVPPRQWARSWAVLAEYGYEREAAERLRGIAYDDAQVVEDRVACAIALADAGSWLSEALSLVRTIRRQWDLGAQELVMIAGFLCRAGEWSEAIEVLDALNVGSLDEELIKRLAEVPVRTLLHRDGSAPRGDMERVGRAKATPPPLGR